jgi:hypothetical protein
MKLRVVAVNVHGTSFVSNLTQDAFVRIGLVSNGVGNCISLLKGGIKTETISNPTIPPINNQKIEIILSNYLHGLNFDGLQFNFVKM